MALLFLFRRHLLVIKVGPVARRASSPADIVKRKHVDVIISRKRSFNRVQDGVRVHVQISSNSSQSPQCRLPTERKIYTGVSGRQMEAWPAIFPYVASCERLFDCCGIGVLQPNTNLETPNPAPHQPTNQNPSRASPSFSASLKPSIPPHFHLYQPNPTYHKLLVVLFCFVKSRRMPCVRGRILAFLCRTSP